MATGDDPDITMETLEDLVEHKLDATRLQDFVRDTIDLKLKDNSQNMQLRLAQARRRWTQSSEAEGRRWEQQTERCKVHISNRRKVDHPHSLHARSVLAASSSHSSHSSHSSSSSSSSSSSTSFGVVDGTGLGNRNESVAAAPSISSPLPRPGRREKLHVCVILGIVGEGDTLQRGHNAETAEVAKVKRLEDGTFALYTGEGSKKLAYWSRERLADIYIEYQGSRLRILDHPKYKEHMLKDSEEQLEWLRLLEQQKTAEGWQREHAELTPALDRLLSLLKNARAPDIPDVPPRDDGQPYTPADWVDWATSTDCVTITEGPCDDHQASNNWRQPKANKESFVFCRVCTQYIEASARSITRHCKGVRCVQNQVSALRRYVTSGISHGPISKDCQLNVGANPTP